MLDEARRDIERMWDEWPQRPERATTFDMRKFYDHLLDKWKALLEYRDFTTTDERWQEVKYWLIAYEELKRPRQSS
jgi:hypothetical protein